MNKLIEKYNLPDTLAFISSYPEKNKKYSDKVCAVGGFTKNTIEQMNKKKKYVVFTVQIGKKPEYYEENNVLVCRIIDRKNVLSILSLSRLLISFSQIRNIIIEFEFGSFGTVVNTVAFTFIFLLNNLLNKRQFTVLHQVVNNLQSLTGHLGWEPNKSFKTIFFNYGLQAYYRFITKISCRVIVTEEYFKKILLSITHTKTEKIIFIPHGVDTHLKKYNKIQVRKEMKLPLNKQIILFFGYLSWYKGADLIVRFARQLTNKKVHFVIAGGPSFTNTGKKYYNKYLDQFKSLPNNLTLTGFVPEEQIAKYYSAADLVFLPYRIMMSSSGPLSLAFSNEKPVILSDKLTPYSYSFDFKENLKNSGISHTDIFIKPTLQNLMKKLKTSQQNKFLTFSKRMKAARNYKLIANQYLNCINSYVDKPSTVSHKISRFNQKQFRFS